MIIHTFCAINLDEDKKNEKNILTVSGSLIRVDSNNGDSAILRTLYFIIFLILDECGIFFI
jgi:hypothetical protein